MILCFQPPEDPKPLKEEESLLFKTKTTKVTFISSNQNGIEDRKHSDSEGWLDMKHTFMYKENNCIIVNYYNIVCDLKMT